MKPSLCCSLTHLLASLACSLCLLLICHFQKGTYIVPGTIKLDEPQGIVIESMNFHVFFEFGFAQLPFFFLVKCKERTLWERKAFTFAIPSVFTFFDDTLSFCTCDAASIAMATHQLSFDCIAYQYQLLSSCSFSSASQRLLTILLALICACELFSTFLCE